MRTRVFEICLEGFHLEGGLNCSFDRDLMAQQMLNVRWAYLEKLAMEFDEY